MMVDDCIPQNAVKPCTRNTLIPQLAGVLERTHVRQLQDIFRSCAILHPTHHERQKASAGIK